MARLPLLALALRQCAANYYSLVDRFTADPAPYVLDGRLYIFTSHDLDDQRGWKMTDYSLMSTTDLANWRDDGIPFDLKNQSWGEFAWAQQVIDGPGGFYMFYPAMDARPGDKRSGTGVAFSPFIEGPFNDALGHPLLPCGDDPTVFRDDDGVAYVCGNCNGGALCAHLAPNMTSLASEPILIQLPQWFEAPWLSKWKGVYYLSYMCAGDAAQGGHGHGDFNHLGYDICYGSCSGPACSPLGPYVFRGSLMWSPPGNCGQEDSSSACSGQNSTAGDNNHQGVVEFPSGSGVLYLAYHTRALAYSRDAYHGFQRNVAIDRLFARDGAYPLPSNLPWVVNDTVPGAGGGLLPVTSTPSWVRQLHYIDPYSRVPATLAASMSAGLGTEACAEGGRNLGFISNGATLQLKGVDFGASPGASSLVIRVASPLTGCSVVVLADGAPVGPPCDVPNTGDWQVFTNVTCAVTHAVGVVTNLTFVFQGPGTTGLMNVIYWAFSGGMTSGATPPPVVVRVALRSAATDLYACARAADGVVTPSGSTPCPWMLSDLGDGTWALSTGEGAVQRWACLERSGPMVATATAAGAICTRFWLYGTPVGSYALLSAGGGAFAVATTDPAVGIVTGGVDPRTTPADGARFWIEEGV